MHEAALNGDSRAAKRLALVNFPFMRSASSLTNSEDYTAEEREREVAQIVEQVEKSPLDGGFPTILTFATTQSSSPTSRSTAAEMSGKAARSMRMPSATLRGLPVERR